MAEVFQEALTNTEQQEHAVETNNLPAPSSPLTEEQHNHKEFRASLSESQNEDNAVQEESIQESTMSVQDLCSALPVLDTVSELEQAGEEQVEPIEPVEEGVSTQLVGEGNQQEHEQLEQEEQEEELEEEEEQEEQEQEEQEQEEEEQEEQEQEEEEQEEQEQEQEEEEQEEQEQEDQQEQEIQEQQSIHDHQCEVQEVTASTNTSYSNTTDNNTIPQQQEEEEEEEEEEEDEDETRNTLPEIPAAPLPPVINNNRIRSASTATPSTVNGLLPRSQRVWEMDRQASECRRCHRRFNFLVRRHHCRYTEKGRGKDCY
jgi:hypothetical protein